MGILILAPANSIGDYVADTALARSGKAVTAFGAVYSGPLLNLLLGVGISCTIANFANKRPVPLKRTAIEFACAATVEYALLVGIFILVFSGLVSMLIFKLIIYCVQISIQKMVRWVLSCFLRRVYFNYPCCWIKCVW